MHVQSSEEDRSTSTTTMSRMYQRVIKFPSRLHQMLSEVERDGLAYIVSWQPDGRCFRVHDQDAFVQLVLPRYFSQTKYRSFQRQLNHYGFERVTKGPLDGSYHHKHFWKDYPDRCEGMKRVKKGSTASKQQNEKPLMVASTPPTTTVYPAVPVSPLKLPSYALPGNHSLLPRQRSDYQRYNCALPKTSSMKVWSSKRDSDYYGKREVAQISIEEESSVAWLMGSPQAILRRPSTAGDMASMIPYQSPDPVLEDLSRILEDDEEPDMNSDVGWNNWGDGQESQFQPTLSDNLEDVMSTTWSSKLASNEQERNFFDDDYEPTPLSQFPSGDWTHDLHSCWQSTSNYQQISDLPGGSFPPTIRL